MVLQRGAAGTGLGANAMLGVDPTLSGVLSAVLAVVIFSVKQAGMALDRVVVLLGVVLIALMLYVALASNPPVGTALKNTVWPDEVNFLVITTLIGGSVGGYITYAGAHRLLDSGGVGQEHVRAITSNSIISILITGVMRALLFLAIFGVVASGVHLTGSNMAADAFKAAAGAVGERLFGMALWAAALTSVIGCSFTSISFVTRSTTSVEKRQWLTVLFIAVCTAIFAVIGQSPQSLLIIAGALNGMILPIGLGILLWVAWRRRDLLEGYAYPVWMLLIGGLAWVMTLYIAGSSIGGLSELIFPS